MTESAEKLSPIKRALLELRDMRGRINEMEHAQSEPIAIVGLGMRFPGDVHDPDSFWKLLSEGTDAIVPIPESRWDMEAFFDEDPEAPGKMYTRAGGFLTDVDQFDPHFFGISPREATSMDPQQRLLLQVSWEALEHAGQSPDLLKGSQTGVFLGMSNSDYFRMTTADPDSIDVYTMTGGTFSVAAGRLSYLLGLQGPSMVVDTACSSSLVAMHLACQSLRAGESDLALAGGVNLILQPEANINFSKAQMMAPDDRCKTFDARADGYVRGEGCGMIALKRLSDATADGNTILALVKGTAVNQDGRSSGLTAPNGPSQEAVILKAVENAKLKPEQIQYVEAHGTGTSLGDPIEVQALAATLGQNRPENKPLAIGSVKTNLGHLEAAAGIAGIIKVALALQHKEIPPHLHLQELNPFIPWDTMSIVVPTEPTPWPEADGSRLASVSSFGFSGTNAHVILAEAPEVTGKERKEERPFNILNLSARNDKALRQLVAKYTDFLAADTSDWDNICTTSQIGRAHLANRLSVIASSKTEAIHKLNGWAAGEEPSGVVAGAVQSGNSPDIAFLFTGHGAQHIHMGHQLYQSSSVFREAIDACTEAAKPYLNQSLLTALFPETTSNETLMDSMTYGQPALFAVEYALAKLWFSWGIKPTMVMGHSLGEYVAACISGVFNLDDGLKLVCARGRLMDSLPETGKMAVIFAPEAKVKAAIEPYGNRVSIGVVNGPTSLVISGEETAVQSIVDLMEKEDIKTRALAVAIAAHSPLLDPVLDEFESIAATIDYHPPQIALVSCMTGNVVGNTEVTKAAYWRTHLRQPVRFADGMTTLYEEKYGTFVEIGPHPTMLGMGHRCWPPELDTSLPTIDGVWRPSLRKDADDWQEMLESLAALHVNRVSVNWERFAPKNLRRVPLPTNPWQTQSYWLDDKTQTPQVKPSDLWQAVSDAGQHQQVVGPLDLGAATYPAKWDALAKLTSGYILQAIRGLGAFAHAGEQHTIEGFLAQFNILPTYIHLMRRWLNRMVADGFLDTQGDTYVSTTPLPERPLPTDAPILQDLPELLAYIHRCGKSLTGVLTGTESPLETLFPGGATTTADFLYNQWAMVRYFNGISREVVQAIANLVPGDKQVRLLEIGAGTGGTAAALLPILPPHQTSYRFTDVSELFLTRAQERFQATYPFVEYSLFNAENDPTEQGLAMQSYDVIVAANVIHATSDLNHTLSTVRKLLAPGGIFLLYEVVDHFAWFDITTSLIEGWGIFEDEWRTDDPLLPNDKWQAALLKNGFAQVHSYPEDGTMPAEMGSRIIVSQAPASESGGKSIFGTANYAPQDNLEETAVSPEDDETQTAVDTFLAELIDAIPDEREEMLINLVRSQVAQILRMPPDETIDQKARLMDLGVDSLIAVELRNRLQTRLNLENNLPATLIFDYPTIAAIVIYLDAQVIQQAKTEPVEGQEVDEMIANTDSTTAVSTNIDELTDEDVEAMLLKKLEDL